MTGYAAALRALTLARSRLTGPETWTQGRYRTDAPARTYDEVSDLLDRALALCKEKVG